MDNLDVVVVGAGVIGLAIGRAFALSGREVTVIESHPSFGHETSSRNSEVIHAGIYYPNNSLKAKLCVSGKKTLYNYCLDRSIACKAVGKLIVAANDHEAEILLSYQKQAHKNGVTDLSYLSVPQLASLESELQGTAALFSPSTGIIDSHELMEHFVSDISNNHGTLIYNSTISGGQLIESKPVINVSGSENCTIRCNLLINCGGLFAQTIATSLGLSDSLVPPNYYAKGHYYELKGSSPFNHLIYPVANSAGLGIHSTLNLSGQLRFGPDVKWVKKIDYTFDNSTKREFVKAIKRYYPNLDEQALQPSYTGIRPKVVGPGNTPGDFIIQTESDHGYKGLVNCYGMESPGLTASMAIADYVLHNHQ